ncbi:MAG: type II toxin-antitoxin system HicB family antitoxin [Candidatus Altiarchaeota archaeon]|nr:type II toxin-antitoxin system HicB family antitoxin [Candidatus Altiarchaeota archaeon]
MEKLINIKIEKLEEGGYLATSEDFEDLMAQGDTIEETIEIARDVAKKLIESYEEHGDPLPQSVLKRELKKSTFAVPIASA